MEQVVNFMHAPNLEMMEVVDIFYGKKTLTIVLNISYSPTEIHPEYLYTQGEHYMSND